MNRLTYQEDLEELLMSFKFMDITPCPTQAHFNEIINLMARYIDELIVNDFNKLLSILYRIDVSEEKVKGALAMDAGKASSGHTIARLLIERETEKIKLRAKYSKK